MLQTLSLVWTHRINNKIINNNSRSEVIVNDNNINKWAYINNNIIINNSRFTVIISNNKNNTQAVIIDRIVIR